jgi:hypothetical protein
MFNMGVPITKNKHAEWKMIEGKAVVFNINDGVLLKLDEVGTAVWNMIDGVKSGTELACLLTEQFEVDLAEVQRDVRHLLKSLWSDEVIEYAQAGG